MVLFQHRGGAIRGVILALRMPCVCVWCCFSTVWMFWHFYNIVIASTLTLLSSVSATQGNYDAYVRTRAELEENQMKMYNWEQAQMQHMKANKPSCLSLPPSLPHPLTRSSLPPSLPPTFPPGLCGAVWPWQCQAGPTGTEQGEGVGQDGRWWPHRESAERQGGGGSLTRLWLWFGMEDLESGLLCSAGGLILVPRLWHNPSACDHGAGC